jgi:hypothetical protein
MDTSFIGLLINIEMNRQTGRIVLYAFLILISVLMTILLFGNKYRMNNTHSAPIADIGEIRSLGSDNRWARSFLAADGTIYFKEPIKSNDGGITIIDQNDTDLEEINRRPERAVLAKENLFYALDARAVYESPGVYRGMAWRSDDNLKNIYNEEPLFYIPGGIEPRSDVTRWFGLFIYRTIIEMPDSSWLMTMYGNFSEDTLKPYNRDAIHELEFMMRTFIMTSQDNGRTWNYLSTVAVPKPGEPVGEGFVEPAITLLNDGRLLCIMRSGHHYPLYASWSSDLGKTWTPPLYTGMDRGCDPCLITLKDGRVALSWGKRFPEGWSKITPEGDKGSIVYPGEGYTNLSISKDGGVTWKTTKIVQPAGSCYSTIFEVEPNIVFMQVDQWYCRISLNKHQQ